MAPNNTKSLAAAVRSKTGSTASAALRRAGMIPASLFGHGSAPAAIALDAKDFDAVLHAGGRNALLTIALSSGPPDTALVREVQRDPITRRVVHADLQRVSATEEIRASLPLVAVGVAEGVKNGGGVMDIVLHAVDVTGRADALPETLEADVSRLSIGDHLTAGELLLPQGLALAIEPATVLISIEASRTAADAAEAAPTSAAEPQLVTAESSASE